ncbi:hypothetical protein BD560DRAFT_40334 [Blakeslea trispora]|nr:hypothetical protein BD560DRAFT_40334 [Blakeslea trispora]
MSSSSRKVYLAVRGEEGVELALCEFKAARDNSVLKKQEGKCLRYNQCVLEALKQKGLETKIIAFNWGGNRGEMFSLKESSGVYLAKSINRQLILPDDHRVDETFVNTMITFCAWRRHLVTLNETAFVAKKKGDICSSSSRKRKTLVTCFSPKWEANKRSNIVNFLNDDILDVYKANVDPFFWKTIDIEEDGVASVGFGVEEDTLARSSLTH